MSPAFLWAVGADQEADTRRTEEQQEMPREGSAAAGQRVLWLS